jgi:hypothetical protein
MNMNHGPMRVFVFAIGLACVTGCESPAPNVDSPPSLGSGAAHLSASAAHPSAGTGQQPGGGELVTCAAGTSSMRVALAFDGRTITMKRCNTLEKKVGLSDDLPAGAVSGTYAELRDAQDKLIHRVNFSDSASFLCGRVEAPGPGGSFTNGRVKATAQEPLTATLLLPNAGTTIVWFDSECGSTAREIGRISLR